VGVHDEDQRFGREGVVAQAGAVKLIEDELFDRFWNCDRPGIRSGAFEDVAVVAAAGVGASREADARRAGRARHSGRIPPVAELDWAAGMHPVGSVVCATAIRGVDEFAGPVGNVSPGTIVAAPCAGRTDALPRPRVQITDL
jgi:hypothetical protein